jgi:putative membrane protein
MAHISSTGLMIVGQTPFDGPRSWTLEKSANGAPRMSSDRANIATDREPTPHWRVVSGSANGRRAIFQASAVTFSGFVSSGTPPRKASPALASACAVLLGGAIVLALHELGPHSRHMAAHLISMNLVAPLVAAILSVRRAVRIGPALLWITTFGQIAVLWLWHAPAVYNATATSAPLQTLMHGSLFVAALLLWFSVINVRERSRWQAIPALIVTGKLACLLAALLIFAPRTLYAAAAHLTHAYDHLALDDQQLAGLLMITVCPLSYLVAAVVLAVQWIGPGTSETPRPDAIAS